MVLEGLNWEKCEAVEIILNNDDRWTVESMHWLPLLFHRKEVSNVMTFRVFFSYQFEAKNNKFIAIVNFFWNHKYQINKMNKLAFGVVQLKVGLNKAENVARAITKIRNAKSLGAQLIALPGLTTWRVI